MKHISLFSGIGGFDLAAEWMGWENVAHCEWNPFGQQVLKYYWPNSISYHDITKTDFSIHRGNIDIVTGGFPCQGFSLAGKRMGTDDDRYLWPEMRRAYRESNPRIIIGENVTGIISMEDKSGVCRDVFPKMEGGTIVRTLECDYYEKVYTRQAKMLINTICCDLEEDGYEVQTFVIPAASVGAPHKRDRVWVIAYANSDGHRRNNRAEQTGCPAGKGKGIQEQRERFRDFIGRNGTAENVTNPYIGRCKRPRFIKKKHRKRSWSNIIGHTRFENFPTQSPVCNGDDGFSSRLDGITFSKWRNESIKAGGNAIVPQVVYQIFKAIEQYENLK